MTLSTCSLMLIKAIFTEMRYTFEFSSLVKQTLYSIAMNVPKNIR